MHAVTNFCIIRIYFILFTAIYSYTLELAICMHFGPLHACIHAVALSPSTVTIP